ncbi:hypothetical protein [Mucilaginibacter sp. dw_454]|uniref:hypothetical protein n=1 Tax=Mucilaginibacter sp. dw_454 TaxID=2720079 RepID=UPI001BD24A98|nr:hypothetical protein [Mucilaginibacter sp. dw_454]
MKRYLIFAGLLLAACAANAQDYLKGTVNEVGTNQRLSNVFIKDVNNKKITLVDKDGKFEIQSTLGHTLIFDSPGYVSDTLFIVDNRPLKVEMRPLGIILKDVTITSTRSPTFNPREEYPEVYTKSKVAIFSPSTWFSREGKNARRLKKFFTTEERERYIDQVYTRTYVSSLVPLKGADLQVFMAMYRPSYEYVRSNTGPSLAVYINDSYQKYKALPPDQRKMPSLTSN